MKLSDLNKHIKESMSAGDVLFFEDDIKEILQELKLNNIDVDTAIKFLYSVNEVVRGWEKREGTDKDDMLRLLAKSLEDSLSLW